MCISGSLYVWSSHVLGSDIVDMFLLLLSFANFYIVLFVHHNKLADISILATKQNKLIFNLAKKNKDSWHITYPKKIKNRWYLTGKRKKKV